MSFILDALRKSEHDRQRGQRPGLAEVAVAPPTTKKNIWATVAVALLIVNLVAIGVLLLRRAGDGDGQAAATTKSAAIPATSTAPSVTAAAPPSTLNSGPAPVTPTYNEAPGMTRVPGTIPPVLQPALPEDGAGGTRNPLAEELSGEGALDGYDPGYDDGYGDYANPNAGMSGPPQRRGSVVYEHLPEADPITSPSNARAAEQRIAEAMQYPQSRSVPPGSVSRTVPGTNAPEPMVSQATSSNLPTAEELGAQAGVPELHLDIHVYSTSPAERFVFVNSRKYKEGDTLQEGPHVDRITPDAVELSYRGNRFALPRK